MRSRAILGIVGVLVLSLSISTAGASLQESVTERMSNSRQEANQVAYTHYCEASNGYGARGWGYSWSFEQACHIAKSECAARAPYGTFCQATHWRRV